MENIIFYTPLWWVLILFINFIFFASNLKILNLFLFKIIGIILILFGIYFFIKKFFLNYKFRN